MLSNRLSWEKSSDGNKLFYKSKNLWDVVDGIDDSSFPSIKLVYESDSESVAVKYYEFKDTLFGIRFRSEKAVIRDGEIYSMCVRCKDGIKLKYNKYNKEHTSPVSDCDKLYEVVGQIERLDICLDTVLNECPDDIFMPSLKVLVNELMDG